MNTQSTILRGLWLPLITPFRDGTLDELSLRRLITHYSGTAIDGLILGATTGEGMVLSSREVERLVSVSADQLGHGNRSLPLYLGLSGSDTRAVAAAIESTSDWPIDGYLISCPHYTRPSQEGLFQHFSALADATERAIAIYNIPYRTGVNLGNEMMLRLAERPNIIGVKDCSADLAQSFELTRQRPPGFSVMTGEDAYSHTALTNGADGGILASAHVHTSEFADLRSKVLRGDLAGARADWRTLSTLVPLLFAEPSPSPIKHWLWRSGLIDSPEVRLPMVPVTDGLAARIDQEIERWAVLKCA